MKKFGLLLLALTLAACAAPPVTTTEAPTEEVALPTQTPFVVVETVVVTVIPTELPTQVPSATPLPPPTEAPPTQAPATEAPASTATANEAESGLVNVDETLGGGWFTAMTLTADTLSLRCELYKQLTFNAKPTNPDIKQVDFYYRIQDRASGAVFDWQGPRRMSADANGNFALVFSGEDVNSNFRKPNAWFDFQYVGLNQNGGRIGNSEKIVQQVNYTFDCP